MTNTVLFIKVRGPVFLT